MIKILENFFSDPRPKIVIFPKPSVARNFYREVYKTPSKYRDYIPSIDSTPNLDTSRIAAILSMKGQRVNRNIEGDVLKAPLVSMAYTTGGGNSARAGKRPFNWRLPEHLNDANPYTGCVVICDEVHNMIAGVLTNQMGVNHSDIKTVLQNYLEPRRIQYRDKIGRLAENLRTARDAVVVGMTATPIVHDVRDGKLLMSVIKGAGNENHTNHGYISYFNNLSPLLYPIPDPDMNGPVFAGSEVHLVPMGAAAFGAYMHKRLENKSTSFRDSSAYSNLAFPKNQVYDRRYIKEIALALYDEPESVAAKFKAVVDDLINAEGKGLILIHRNQASNGLDLFLNQFCQSKDCEGKVGYLYKCLRGRGRPNAPRETRRY